MGAHLSVPLYRRSLPQRLRLEGSQCVGCERVQFPPLPQCPVCSGRRLRPYRLRGTGSIYALTQVMAAGAPPEFRAQVQQDGAYHVAIVELAEGPKITAQLVGFERPPVIGQPVVAVVRRLYDEEGVIRYGFKFRPGEVAG